MAPSKNFNVTHFFTNWGEQIILPSQFSPGARTKLTRRGEMRLMVAILQDAVDTYQKYQTYSGGKRGHYQRLFREAEEWIFSDDEGYVFTFLNICAILELDPDYLRRKIKNLPRLPPLPPRKSKQPSK